MFYSTGLIVSIYYSIANELQIDVDGENLCPRSSESPPSANNNLVARCVRSPCRHFYISILAAGEPWTGDTGGAYMRPATDLYQACP